MTINVSMLCVCINFKDTITEEQKELHMNTRQKIYPPSQPLINKDKLLKNTKVVEH
jgi:hypothetical protein